jgi:AcrR family transcriptional regulator
VERTRAFNKKLKQLTIIEAARELFLNKRYNAITMDEVAHLAGLTKKTLYTYFPSKLSLYIKLFEGYLDQLRGELENVARQNLPPDQSILTSFEVLYKFSKKNTRFMLLYWKMTSEDFDGKIPDELVSKIKSGGIEILRAGRDSIVKAQEAGYVRQYDPDLFWHIVSSINKGLFVHTDKERKFKIADIDSDDLYNEFVKLLRESLSSGRTGRLPVTRNVSPARKPATEKTSKA